MLNQHCSLPKAMIISSSKIFRKKSSDKKCQSYDLKEIFAKSNAHSQEQNFEGVKRRQNLSKQEHKVFYRCSLPSPLQKRSKDYNGLAISMKFSCLTNLSVLDILSSILFVSLVTIVHVLQIANGPWIDLVVLNSKPIQSLSHHHHVLHLPLRLSQS